MTLPPGEELVSTRSTYTIIKHLADGQISDVYLADHAGDPVAIKLSKDGLIAPSGLDPMDMVADEALTLARLTQDGDPKLKPFLPAMHDSFMVDDRWATVFEYLDGWYTLRQVVDRYPELDPKDWAWMFRRLLAVAGFTTRAGVNHGNINPDNVLIHPEMHGLKVIDWAWAVDVDDNDDDLNASQALKVGIFLLGGDPDHWTLPASVPSQIRSYLNASRDYTGDPWFLLEHLDKLLERLWGRRKFHPFSMT